ncbi:hypothetical protein ISS30_07475 [bacterium]|nr:hypothetical protein [bacterium]
MERRGFIEKFAKAAVGYLIDPEAAIEDRSVPPARFFHQPKIVRVYDETAYINCRLNPAVIKAMISAGLKTLYNDIPPNKLFNTIFPGVMKESRLGLKLFNADEAKIPDFTILTALIEELKYLMKTAGIDTVDFIPWTVKACGYFNSAEIQAAEKIPFDDQLDYPIEVEELKLKPYPHLSRFCQFQTGIVFNAAEEISHPCRNNFLQCFQAEEKENWLNEYPENKLKSVYDRINYPLGMKFRLNVADRLICDNTIAFGNDPVLVDRYIKSGKDCEAEEGLTVIDIINPSAPEIDNVKIKRAGEDIVLSWDCPGYEGEFNIYCGSTKNFRPCREKLLAVTNRISFTDYKAVSSSQYYYKVTKKWGS